MSNVISLGTPKRPNLPQRQGMLLRNFALYRRPSDDVFWLKENAEILNILATGGATVLAHDLDVYRSFYDSLEERLRFFPQYYRFLLSICLDLEALGFEGQTGEKLCAFAHKSNLVASELSDLQRAEASLLLRRRGYGGEDCGLQDRLTAFIEQRDTFALPNKKAAYELTHIAFYLSNYGRDPLTLSESAITSLEYAGLLAYLDQDVDLLSEICVALRFADITPSEIWEDWLAHEMHGFVLTSVPEGAVHDAYHEYLVSNWWADIAGMTGFLTASSPGGLEITRCNAAKGPLRKMSEILYQLGPERSGDWHQMRSVLERSIATEHQHILKGAAQSSNRFPEFFEGFSRAL